MFSSESDVFNVAFSDARIYPCDWVLHQVCVHRALVMLYSDALKAVYHQCLYLPEYSNKNTLSC
jgi:hypothetical protein